MNATALILAAGASSRLHTPKQLVHFNGETLLRHAVRVALSSKCREVIVVTGAYREQCTSEVANMPVTVCHNARWSEGLSSSIRAGMAVVAGRAPSPECVVLSVCDQPYVEAELINRLLDTCEATRRGIVASSYADTLGVPALFTTRYYPALTELQGDRGARSLFQRYAHDCAAVPFPSGVSDIDTEADLRLIFTPAPCLGPDIANTESLQTPT